VHLLLPVYRLGHVIGALGGIAPRRSKDRIRTPLGLSAFVPSGAAPQDHSLRSQSLRDSENPYSDEAKISPTVVSMRRRQAR
jgi:hypothetical protein